MPQNPFDQFDAPGPVYGAPPKPDKPDAPKTTWRTVTGPDGNKFQVSSEGETKNAPTPQQPTEFQSKSNQFYTRMLTAERQYRDAAEEGRQPRGVFGQMVHDAVPTLQDALPEFMGGNSEARQIADRSIADFIAATLRVESGAAIGPAEFDKQYRIFFPLPGNGPDVIKNKAIARQQAMLSFRDSAGPLADQADERYRNQFGDKMPWDVAPAKDEAPPTVGAPTQGAPSFDPGPQQQKLNESGFRQEDDPALVARDVSGAFAAMLAQSVAPGQGVQRLRELGVTDPIVLRDAAAQLQFRRKNPGVPLDKYSFPAIDDRSVELSTGEKVASTLGGTAGGAYLMNAGQFLSGNTLDNMATDPERARAGMDIANQQSPNAAALGQVSGGILAAMTGEAGLARMGMAPGLLRGATADVAMGAANGAGMADNPTQSRAGNALTGGVSALAGNLAGNALTKGVGRVVSPSGGSMGALYEAGVTPTLGQRMADKGVIGAAINNTEQALQSVPFVGSAIRGARQESRDQFQLGAFNDALKEVGEQLPKGVKPGTVPHGYAQKTFDRVYAEARSGMTMQADGELAQELGQLAPDISTLGPASKAKLEAIMRNNVNNRMANGMMDGEAFKKTVSDLGKHVARLRKSTDADQQQLADVIEGVDIALHNAARRHSDPEAVALLDAADRGYAKFVRIEMASEKVGGNAGTFSPKGFDRAVQTASGGVRSKAYLRGDALMQDYATAGKGLDDTLPNSGTADRVMAGYAVGAPVTGAVGYASPPALAILGAIGTAYAPGVRKIQQAALKPAGPKRQAVRKQLEKISRIAAASGASTAVSLQGTSPGQ